MRRLTRYLARLFAADALILFGVVCFLLWLVSCLRAFDVVSVKGQGLGTLALQGVLAMPPLAISFLYICVGIGLARALQSLQASHEMHIIHTSHGLGSLWRATALVASIGVVLALLLSNFVEPWSNRQLNRLTAEVAADLVSSALKPQRFTQATPGVVLWIGGRSGDGEIQQFFADDRRDPETRRTYIAATARVSEAEGTYVVQLANGKLQYLDVDGRYSEIAFARYDLNVQQLSQPFQQGGNFGDTDSLTLALGAINSGGWTPELTLLLANRSAEGLRMIGICMIVLAMLAFPSGRRTRLQVPMEAVVLLVGFSERGLSTYSPLGTATGAVAMMIVGGAMLAVRLRPHPIKMVTA